MSHGQLNREVAVAIVSLSGMFPGLEHLEAGHPLVLALPTVFLAAVKMSPKEAKMRCWIRHADCWKHLIDLLGSVKPWSRAALSRE